MRPAGYSGVRLLSNSICQPPRLLATLIAIMCWAGPWPVWALSDAEKTWEQLQHDGTDAVDTGEYWIAEPLLTKAVIQAGIFGFADLRLAKSMGELGRLYAVRGRFTDAEPYLEEQLFIKENALGRDSDQIIPAIGSMCRFYLLYGTASKADPLTEDILSFVEGKLRDPLPLAQKKVTFQKGVPLEGWAGTAAPAMRDPVIDWAITCDDLGEIYRGRGNLDLAERLFKAALTIKSTVLGNEHLSLANSYDSLGEICLARGDNAMAESFFRDALGCTEKILPPENPEVYARLDKLARCLIKLGKNPQAEELYLRAQSFWKVEPSNCGNEARALFALGSLYVDERKYAMAVPVLQQALQLAEQYNGPSSIALVPYLQKYAYALYYFGGKPEADHLKARANVIAGSPR